jgi:hypothetical protein
MKIYETLAGINETVIRPVEGDTLLSEEEQALYRLGVEILLWLMKHSRPDIANAVREASKVLDGATKAHWKYLPQIIKYVTNINERKMHLEVDWDDICNDIEVEGFYDSDFAGDRDTRKSVAGYGIYLMDV